MVLLHDFTNQLTTGTKRSQPREAWISCFMTFTHFHATVFPSKIHVLMTQKWTDFLNNTLFLFRKKCQSRISDQIKARKDFEHDGAPGDEK